MGLDIQTTVWALIFLFIMGIILTLISGIKSIKTGEQLQYFRKKREKIAQGWRSIGFALFLAIGAAATSIYAETTIYKVFPPSPTITITPTITQTLTITVTPTITLTPTITFTPAISNTPQLPGKIITQITSIITPNPAAVFSPIVFSLGIDKNRLPQRPGTEFANPIPKLYGTFSYDKMLEGSQWSALWYRVAGRELVCVESNPWDGSTGGYGYTECVPAAGFQPGDYDVEMYLGTTWKRTGRFTVTGNPPRPTTTSTATSTVTPTRTATPTYTRTMTRTPTSTRTIPVIPAPSQTVSPAITRP